jgi:hypothetical protein
MRKNLKRGFKRFFLKVLFVLELLVLFKELFETVPKYLASIVTLFDRYGTSHIYLITQKRK